MKYNVKMNTYKEFLISVNNVVTDVNINFLELTEYSESEILGLTLDQASKLFRIDSQINLKDVEGYTSIIVFTKELLAIEGIISCEIIDNGAKKVFSFEKNPFNCTSQSFKLASELGTLRGDGVAILSFSNLVLINCNQKFLNYLEPAYNKRINSIGINIGVISNDYLNRRINNIKDFIINTGKPYNIDEIEMHSKVLGKQYWNITGIPILNKSIIKYMVLYMSNVTEKVLNREAIEEKNKNLKTIIENISDEIIIFDKDFNIDISNMRMKIEENTTLNNSHSIHHKKIDLNTFFVDLLDGRILLLDEDNQLITDENFSFQKVARGEVVSNHIIKIINGSEVEYREVHGDPIFDKDGKFKYGIMIYIDINDRILKEESRLINTQKEPLGKVVESMNLEYIWCTYPDLSIISLSENSLNKLKKINKKIKSFVNPIGESYFSIHPADKKKKRKELEYYLIEKGDDSYTSYSNYIIDGEERFFKTINQPIFGLNNKIVEIIFITTDITDQVNEKNKMKETLDSQNQLFANISHELKTPLSMIFSSSQLIEMYLKKGMDNMVKENIRKSVDIIKQNSFRFTKLINNIIDLSSFESGFYSLNLENKNIIEIVENIVDSVRDYAKNRGLNIIFDTEIEEKIMAVDEDKMDRILLNLISNAIKFSPIDGTIYINIKDKEDYVDILVGDSGAGIDKEHLNTIFYKYHKVDNTLYKNSEGSGIGLTLVKIMTELLGGEIRVESQIGEGTLFTVSLPVKLLAESEVIKNIHPFNKTIDKITIEFSDINFDCD